MIGQLEQLEPLSKSLSESLSTWFYERGFDPTDLDRQGNNGDTALMKAIQLEQIALARSILQVGTNLNLRNNDGNNALWFACFRDQIELIHALIEAQINIDNQNDNGATALMYAASAGKAKIVQVLLTAGADPWLKNLDDFQAVDFATNFEILRILQHATGRKQRIS